ncbi:MAG: hypothetical protein ABWK01_05845, partial [Infirmifilum sp.]
LAFLLSGLIVGTSSLLLAVATMKDVSLAWLPLVKLKAGSIGESRFFTITFEYGIGVVSLLLTLVYEVIFGAERASKLLKHISHGA